MRNRRKIRFIRQVASRGAVLFCLTLVPSLSAQYSGLSVTDDGRQLYFGSRLRLKGTDESEREKIFRYNVDRFEQFASSGDADLLRAQTSGDGRVVTWFAHVPCPMPAEGNRACVGPEGRHVVAGADVPAALTTPGTLVMSRNGRYFLRPGTVSPPADPVLYNRVTDTISVLQGLKAIYDGQHSLANNGSVVLLDDAGRLVVWRAGARISLAISRPPIMAAISADGSTVVYESAELGEVHRLSAYSMASGLEITLAEGPPAIGSYAGRGFGPPGFVPPAPKFYPSLSNDGRLVLYRAPSSAFGDAQAVTQQTDGSARRLLASDIPVHESVLSGDGRTAFLISAGRLIQVDVPGGATHVLLRKPLIISRPGSPLVPGALMRITGDGLMNADGSLNVRIEQGSWAILEAYSTSVLLQASWDLPLSRPVMLTASAPDHPFEQVIQEQPAGAAPVMFRIAAQDVIVHEDFRGLVTGQDPAAPGEILHVYVTGLGAVRPPIANGAPAPADVLHHALAAVACSGTAIIGEAIQDLPIPLLFAGLAPGTIGLYQLDVRLPAISPAPRALNLKCSVSDPNAIPVWMIVPTSRIAAN